MLKLEAVSILLSGARMKLDERLELEENVGLLAADPGKKLSQWRASIPAGLMREQFVKDVVAETQLVEGLILRSGGLSARAVQLKLRIPKWRLDVLASWVQGWNSRIVFDQNKRAFRVLSEGSREHLERVRDLNAQADEAWKKFVEDMAGRITRQPHFGQNLDPLQRRRLEALIRESMASVGIF